MPAPVQRGSVLSAADAAASDQFGVGVALAAGAQILAVGANNWEGAAGADRGGVYIYDLNSSAAWIARGSVIEASDAADTDLFGTGVALSSDGLVLAVGAFQWEGAGSNQGGVYLYDWSGSAWVQRGSVLAAADAAADDYFGYAVALSDDGSVLAVGARIWEGPTSDQGGVYIYDWSGSAWVQRGSVLTAADAAGSDFFGGALSLSADGAVLAVGAAGWEGATGADRGGVYIYDWSGSAWVQRGSVIEAADAENNDNFGFSVALSADAAVLAVGAMRWEGAAGTDRGGVYIYDWYGSAWVQRGSVIEAADAADSDFYGRALALSESADVLVVGAHTWESGATANIGGVYTYTIQDEIAGAATGVATATGSLQDSGPAGAATATATAAGDLTTAIQLAGAALTVATASGALTLPITLSGAAAAIGAAAGELTTGVSLAGDAPGQASASGDLSTGVNLAGTAAVVSAAAGALSDAFVPLAGAGQGQALAAGDLSTEIRLDANAVVQALAAAGLETQIQLAGDAQIQVAAVGNLTDMMTGAAAAEALASGSLTTQIHISGAALIAALASAGLTTGIAIAGSAAAEALASANLTVGVTFTAAAVAEAIAAAGLTTQVQLAGAAAGAAGSTGHLTTSPWIFGQAAAAATAGAPVGDGGGELILSPAPTPFRTFILGGLSLTFESHLDLDQDYIEEQASRITRHCDGSARKQTCWRGKLRTRISGQGWIPSGFDLLDYAEPLEMSCIALRAISSASNVIDLPADRRADRGFQPFAYATVGGGKRDTTLTLSGDTATVATVDGAALYTVCYYPKLTVFADPPRQQHDAINDKYSWSFEAREV
jgi:hypothetical protein